MIDEAKYISTNGQPTGNGGSEVRHDGGWWQLMNAHRHERSRERDPEPERESFPVTGLREGETFQCDDAETAKRVSAILRSRQTEIDQLRSENEQLKAGVVPEEVRRLAHDGRVYRNDLIVSITPPDRAYTS